MAKKSGAVGAKKNTPWQGLPSLKDHRREAILRRVASLLRNSRLSSLTIQDVADELGMTKGNVYYYFKDKQEILYYCHMRSMEISLHALHEAMQSGGTPANKLRTLLIQHIRAIVDEGFGSILQTDLENLSAEQRRNYVRQRDELERGVRRLIDDGARLGEFECANVKLTGFAILGAINWIAKWYHPSGQFTPQQIAEEMTDFFLRGLLPRTAVDTAQASQQGPNEGLADGQHRHFSDSER